MKILQILPEMNVGGVETGTVDFARYLVEHGHQSIVVSNGGELVARLEESGTRHYALPVHKKSLRTMWKMVHALGDIIQKEGVDIVHARSRIPAWIAYFACRGTNAAFITTCHGYYQSRFFSQVMGWPKMVIVPSKAIGRRMIDGFKVSAGSIRCIPRSVDLGKFNISRNDAAGKSFFTVAMIGRITPLKGHAYFLKAMARVVRGMPNVRIWIIGGAPRTKEVYKRDLEVLVKRLGIKDYVEFLGSRSDVPQLLAQTDVLVLSTVTQESFGRVILEAQAAGVPVVATRVGGVVDIIEDGKTGILVMPRDTEGMAKEVTRLLKDKALSAQLVAAAQEKLRREFTLDQMASRTIQVYEELRGCLNILVIKLSSIGDVVLVTASLKALREKFPRAKIYCLVGVESRKVLQNCPHIDGIIIYDSLHKNKGWFRTVLFSHKLRKYRFDKVIDFQNNRKSHLLAFLSFPAESYGYNNGKWACLLTHPLEDCRRDIPAVDHQFRVLKALGISDDANVSLELWPSSHDRQYVQELLDSEWLRNCENMVGINIAASVRWQTKTWPLEHISRLCDILAGKGIRVILTGVADDRETARQILLTAKSKPAVFAGKTDILQLGALIERCKVFVTGDSAPLHVAAAMKTPVVALFGPTDSKRHMPPAAKMAVIEKKPACSPCYSPYCLVATHACMREILPEEVAGRVESFIGVTA